VFRRRRARRQAQSDQGQDPSSRSNVTRLRAASRGGRVWIGAQGCRGRAPSGRDPHRWCRGSQERYQGFRSGVRAPSLSGFPLPRIFSSSEILELTTSGTLDMLAYAQSNFGYREREAAARHVRLSHLHPSACRNYYRSLSPQPSSFSLFSQDRSRRRQACLSLELRPQLPLRTLLPDPHRRLLLLRRLRRRRLRISLCRCRQLLPFLSRLTRLARLPWWLSRRRVRHGRTWKPGQSRERDALEARAREAAELGDDEDESVDEEEELGEHYLVDPRGRRWEQRRRRHERDEPDRRDALFAEEQVPTFGLAPSPSGLVGFSALSLCLSLSSFYSLASLLLFLSLPFWS
jgi:hypothetical protein